ncbi:MAG: cupin domain-containing protein [Kofleriaceae bacterium]
MGSLVRSAWLAAALAHSWGCSSPAPAPAPALAPGHPHSPAAAPTDAATSATADAATPSNGNAVSAEQKAALVKAMNELDEVAQQCWAAAAVDRLDIEGSITAQIEIAQTTARSTIVSDTARNPKLAACLRAVLDAYHWAPPLYGQTIQLPFQFRASDSQNTIDRKLATWNGQAKLSLAVLLDENNSGNAAASMLELAIDGGGTTGMRTAERAELWFFLGPATAKGPAGKPIELAAGDMMFVPAHGGREVSAKPGASPVHAVIAIVPGGPEGAARAGALPTPALTSWQKPPPGPIALPASKTTRIPLPSGGVRIQAEPSTINVRSLAASVLELRAGASVPEHVHATETEMLYVLAGSGTMTVNGVALSVTPTSVIQIPPNTRHAFTASADVRALQIYTPAGPEQRFKKVAKP